MCGIVGFLSTNNSVASLLFHAVEAMEHRGPDDQGVIFIDPQGNIAHQADDNVQPYLGLGQARFSLVDLSAAGHQPFLSDDGKVCLVFNGEIYNYVELRAELEELGVAFSTKTDTEVIAKAYSYWGVDCFERFSGFWAVVLFDRVTNKTLISRDRLGKAPLYFCKNEEGFFWSSEINSLLKLVPKERKNIDEKSILHFANWLKKDFGNNTFYKNIKTFPSASYAWLNENGELDSHKYWALPTTRRSETEVSVDEAAEEFKVLMDEAVRIRIRADAPVAVQLSGGMDSSTLLACAANHTDKIDAYTVEYGYGPQNEEPYARMVAEKYKDTVNYHVVNPVENDLLGELPDYTRHMAEPYHSPNQLSSQHIWRRMSKTGIRAVIYGGGGDEVFAGYGSEYLAPYLRELVRTGKWKRFIKEFFSSSEYGRGIPLKDYLKMGLSTFSKVARRSTHGRVRFVGANINPLNTELLGVNVREPSYDLDEKLDQNMKDWRMNYWLRIDNQNSMGVPVELRSPFLDHKIVEFAFGLPVSYLIRDGWLKWIVRKSMESKLPQEVVWRKQKMGFPFPLTEWLEKNEAEFKAMLYDAQCPYVSSEKLFNSYSALNESDSEYLWGMISILMWWVFFVNEN